MNKIISILLIAAITLSCSKKETETSNPKTGKGSLQIGFTLPSSKSKLKSTSSIANVVAAVISITDANGNPVHTLKQLPLLKLNGSYITEALLLNIGAYKLTSFSLVDNTGNVIYATPVANSSKAYLVSKPLPIDVLITKDAVNKISPEVIGTENTTPSDFGYTTFSFNEVKTFDFLIGAFVYNSTTSNFELTTANLSISKATQVIYTETLTAATTKITLPDATGNYTLTISKTGYITYTASFTEVELKAYLNNPKMAILEKTNLTDGLVAYYPFDSNTNDVTGNGNDATSVNISYVADRKGAANKAIEFNTATSRVVNDNVNNVLDFDAMTQSYSASLWIKTENPHVNGTGYIMQLNSGGNGWPIFFHYSNEFYMDIWDKTNVPIVYNSGQNLADNNWHLLVMVVNNADMKLYMYVDGQYKTSTANTISKSTTGSTYLHIGNEANYYTGNWEYAYSGLIDDVRIYNRALGANEVLEMYNE